MINRKMQKEKIGNICKIRATKNHCKIHATETHCKNHATENHCKNRATEKCISTERFITERFSTEILCPARFVPQKRTARFVPREYIALWEYTGYRYVSVTHTGVEIYVKIFRMSRLDNTCAVWYSSTENFWDLTTSAQSVIAAYGISL